MTSERVLKRPRRPRRRLVVFGVVFAAYALLMLFGGCADKLVLIPTTYAIDSGGASRQPIPIRDGANVEVWVARSPGARRAATTKPAAYLLEFTGNSVRGLSARSSVAIDAAPVTRRTKAAAGA